MYLSVSGLIGIDGYRSVSHGLNRWNISCKSNHGLYVTYMQSTVNRTSAYTIGMSVIRSIYGLEYMATNFVEEELAHGTHID